jgi:hypothetical protein
MSAHNFPFKMYQSPLMIDDPGDAGNIVIDRYGAQVPMVSGSGAETRTLIQPTKAGILCMLVLETDGGGDLTLTVTGGYNGSGDTAIVFDDAGDYVVFMSVKVGTSFYWKAISQDGTDAAIVVTLSVTATAAELNQLDGTILGDMSAGTGISTGTGTICEHSVTKIGGIFKTEILIDLTGLADDGTTNDIIGKPDDTVNCHIGQILAAVNGTIFAGRISCFETPATGDPDIDLWYADEATGAQGAGIAALTSAAQCINHGDWTAEDTDYLTAFPAANKYMYLTVGAGTPDDGTYSAGILLIELWGK